jgi:hypothetical protein
MIASEAGSTAIPETSVFHKLLLLKGTNPPRLALFPGTIEAQAVVVPPVPPPFPVFCDPVPVPDFVPLHEPSKRMPGTRIPSPNTLQAEKRLNRIDHYFFEGLWAWKENGQPP